MSPTAVSPALPFLIALALALFGWLAARRKAELFRRTPATTVHSLPGYHGWFVALCAGIPAVLFALVWQATSPARNRAARGVMGGMAGKIHACPRRGAASGRPSWAPRPARAAAVHPARYARPPPRTVGRRGPKGMP